jgi:hypothetical protein
MQLFPFVAVFALYCFVWAYGIQSRKRWAWLGGWIFGFFAAGAVCTLAAAQILNAHGQAEVIVGLVFLVGGLCVWLFWAVWWSTHRKMFSPRNPSRKSSRRTS